MGTMLKRAVAILLGLLGLVLGGGGIWLAGQLGPSGSAEFTATVSGSSALLVPPAVLNRVDAPATVTVSGTAGSTIWVGVARPSDAAAALDDAARPEITGVVVSDWALTSTARGSGAPPAFARADVWHKQEQGTRAVQVQLAQADAPESLVATAEKGEITQVSVTLHRKAWFVQAVVAALIGLFLILAGVFTWRLDIGGGEARRSAGRRGMSAPAVPSRTDVLSKDLEGSE